MAHKQNRQSAFSRRHHHESAEQFAPQPFGSIDATPRPLHSFANIAPTPSVTTEQHTLQRQEAPEATANTTGLPDTLKAGIEQLSGFSLDDVQVHYNSSKPAHVNALAYTQGTNIHVAPGQEQHLPHEAWHVVQQKQGRVKPTMQMKGSQINNDKGLENEADVMGERSKEASQDEVTEPKVSIHNTHGVLQRYVGILTEDTGHWFYNPDALRDAAFEEAGANAQSIEKLAQQTEDGVEHVYHSWDEAFAATETDDVITEETAPSGPISLSEVRLGGSNAETDKQRFILMNKVVNEIIVILDKNPETAGKYMLGGSYAAALRGTSRSPGDVDIDFITEESYLAGLRIIAKMPKAKIGKWDKSMGQIRFTESYVGSSKRSIPVTIKIEVVNLKTKAINKNVVDGMEKEPSEFIHKGTQVPAIPAMIINWMDRYIESKKCKGWSR